MSPSLPTATTARAPAPTPVPREAPALTAAQRERVAALVAHYERVRTQRMAGVALLHPRLAVQAIGFSPGGEPLAARLPAGPAAQQHPEPVLEGVLLTPWFMSLVRLPQRALRPLRIGQRVQRRFGAMDFEFLGGGEMPLGYHETCALFSPLTDFTDQAQAVATAQAALELVRRGDPQDQPGRASDDARAMGEAVPAGPAPSSACAVPPPAQSATSAATTGLSRRGLFGAGRARARA